jgi:hypothetical protein
MKRALLASALFAMMFVLGGCDEDQRNTDEKLNAAPLDYNTRRVMACPKCGAPTAPWRISEIKSYYRCSGMPPKFKYHPEKEWTHRFHDGEQ